jgi:heme/copper-type cytochrome/quinol oxidase subunit 4
MKEYICGIILSLVLDLILGALAKLRKATIAFVMSVCLSVCSNGTTWPTLATFS